MFKRLVGLALLAVGTGVVRGLTDQDGIPGAIIRLVAVERTLIGLVGLSCLVLGRRRAHRERRKKDEHEHDDDHDPCGSCREAHAIPRVILFVIHRCDKGSEARRASRRTTGTSSTLDRIASGRTSVFNESNADGIALDARIHLAALPASSGVTLGTKRCDLDVTRELCQVARLPVVGLTNDMTGAIKPFVPWVLWGSTSVHREFPLGLGKCRPSRDPQDDMRDKEHSASERSCHTRTGSSSRAPRPRPYPRNQDTNPLALPVGHEVDEGIAGAAARGQSVTGAGAILAVDDQADIDVIPILGIDRVLERANSLIDCHRAPFFLGGAEGLSRRRT